MFYSYEQTSAYLDHLCGQDRVMTLERCVCVCVCVLYEVLRLVIPLCGYVGKRVCCNSTLVNIIMYGNNCVGYLKPTKFYSPDILSCVIRQVKEGDVCYCI